MHYYGLRHLMRREAYILLGLAAIGFLFRKKIVATVKQLSAQGLALIKRHEGLRLSVYMDAAGKPTIGYGHLIKPGETFPPAITEAEAERILLRDTQIAQNAVRNNVKVPINQNQFDALVSLVFNIGAGAFEKSTLLRLLNQGFYNAAAEQFLAWKRAGSHPDILLPRRRKEKELFETGATS